MGQALGSILSAAKQNIKMKTATFYNPTLIVLGKDLSCK